MPLRLSCTARAWRLTAGAPLAPTLGHGYKHSSAQQYGSALRPRLSAFRVHQCAAFFYRCSASVCWLSPAAQHLPPVACSRPLLLPPAPGTALSVLWLSQGARLRRPSGLCMPWPNPSLKGSANSKPPGPRGTTSFILHRAGLPSYCRHPLSSNVRPRIQAFQRSATRLGLEASPRCAPDAATRCVCLSLQRFSLLAITGTTASTVRSLRASTTSATGSGYGALSSLAHQRVAFAPSLGPLHAVA